MIRLTHVMAAILGPLAAAFYARLAADRGSELEAVIGASRGRGRRQALGYAAGRIASLFNDRHPARSGTQ
jgi:hypothetical protein